MFFAAAAPVVAGGAIFADDLGMADVVVKGCPCKKAEEAKVDERDKDGDDDFDAADDHFRCFFLLHCKTVDLLKPSFNGGGEKDRQNTS